MSFSRRGFLRASLFSATGLFAGGIDAALAAIPAGPRRTAEGFGPLRPDPAGLLDLPEGFRYRLLSPGTLESEGATAERFASRLDDGSRTPPLHDGMAAFAGPGGVTVLVRNHEMNLGDAPFVDERRERPYDRLTGGGTTTLWVDGERNLVRSFASVSGTLRNCAGGATPWGSWLTAEEAVAIPGERHATISDHDPRVEQRHGYLFEVDAAATGLVDPVPLKAMGRFRHEAVAVDPETGFAYLTEDREDGLLYRFRPQAVLEGTPPTRLRVGDYARGGVLEALRLVRRPGAVTNGWERRLIGPGDALEVDWVRIPEADPDEDMHRVPGDSGKERAAPGSTREQGAALGCARFARTEGIAYSKRALYFCCTNGGPDRLGQVFRLDLRRQRLTLVVEPDDHAVLDGPDNLCAAPFGDLIICEDNLARRENFVVGVTPGGRCYRIARNAHPARRELAGACFSPDGRTLFVNVQQPGMTFAVWGPWDSRRA
jgi:secreted PhoX family phosphatase